MSNINKSLRIRTNVGEDKYVTVNLDSEYDTLEILSLKINQKGAYRYHTSTYGVVVGRVLANNGFGVPNAKLSLFIPKDGNVSIIEETLYPYNNVSDKDSDGIRYNLLPSNQKDDCHQIVGTFPSKRLILDDNSTLEVFEKYYLYTTRTNESGDYMFFGVPTGTYNLHMDLDISDCGKLSQRPRDFIYKGYNIEQFENPNQFKIDTELSALAQIFTQDTSIEVKPFWGDSQEGTNIGLTREDINVNYKFEPTCVFMGSVISDTPNDGITKKCVPTNRMGDMREMVTGSGTIEIIRKTTNNTIEELQIQGKQLINGDGVWCFQIPMNLDYITTDEYGNTIPTDNPEKGIPTRCEVRFRISMDEGNTESITYKRGKVLVPNNPTTKDIDYEFGSKTKDESFKSLMWNGVYSVKSFIPRFQKARNIKTNKFTGIKNVNIHGSNNPMPYNNIRIRIPFMFWLLCNVAKLFIRIVQVINVLKRTLMSAGLNLINLSYSYIGNELCPDLEYWYFAPGMSTERPAKTVLRRIWAWLTGKPTAESLCSKWQHESACLTFKSIAEELKDDYGDAEPETFYEYLGKEEVKNKPTVLTEEEFNSDEFFGTGSSSTVPKIDDIEKLSDSQLEKAYNASYDSIDSWVGVVGELARTTPRDKQSTEVKNALTENDPRIKLTPDINYLMECVEMNLAQEYEVIKFDFYNDWINGTLYLPRWVRDVKFKRKRRNGKRVITEKVKGCINDTRISKVSRRYMQQCSLSFDKNMDISSKASIGCGSLKLRCHKKVGSDYITVLGKNGGVVKEQKTMLGDYVYYMIPYEFRGNTAIPMFATDIIMLGTLFDCNEYGIPSTFDSLLSTTYKLPTNLALTNVDDDSYSYMDEGDYTDEYSSQMPPTLNEIKNFSCGASNSSGCGLNYLVEDGVQAKIPSYSEIVDMIKENEGNNSVNDEEGIAIEYEDIFPITEMSGIEWGYNGPDQLQPSDNKFFAAGGHFMGLACGNAETNIRSCVNLKRACEIGTTFSERLEIPIGYKTTNEDEFDVVNYLYVSPTGLISNDQVVDVTFRSAFATMNQNSLETETDVVTGHKRYKFNHLIPDSFDGSLGNMVEIYRDKYNQKLDLKQDDYWDEWFKDASLGDKEWFKDATIESGYTVHRMFETKSKDYIKFRHGDEVTFLAGNDRMPVTKNSFYFYFGLKEGYTALDEFKNQFFASCAKTYLAEKEPYIRINSKKETSIFKYNVEVGTYNLTLPFKYTFSKIGDDSSDTIEQEENNKTFVLENVRTGEYNLYIEDSNGVIIDENIKVGIDEYFVNYDTNSIVDYKKTIGELPNPIDIIGYEGENGGTINGTFNLDKRIEHSNVKQYGVEISGPQDFRVRKTVIIGPTVPIAKWQYSFGNREWQEVNDKVNVYDEDNKRLILWGHGTYTIYVFERLNGMPLDNWFEYSSFYVADGIQIPTLKLGEIVGNELIEKEERLFLGVEDNDLNINIINNPDDPNYHFQLYKAIVNYDKSEPFVMPILVDPDDTGFNTIFMGRRETEGSFSDNITDIDRTILIPSTEFNGSKYRGYFYFTAYNSNKGLYATDYVNGVVYKSSYDEYRTIMIHSKTDFNECFVKNEHCIISSKNNLTDNGTLCKITGIGGRAEDGMYQMTCRIDSPITVDEGKEIIIAKIFKFPVFFNPFEFNVLAFLGSDTYPIKKDDNIREFRDTVSCYKNTLGNNFGEYINDYKKLRIYENDNGESTENDRLIYCDFTVPVLFDKLKMKYSHKIGDVNVNIIMRGIIEDGNTEDIKEKIKGKYYFADNKSDVGNVNPPKEGLPFSFNELKVSGKIPNHMSTISTIHDYDVVLDDGETYLIFDDIKLDYFSSEKQWFGFAKEDVPCGENNNQKVTFVKTSDNLLSDGAKITIQNILVENIYHNKASEDIILYTQKEDGFNNLSNDVFDEIKITSKGDNGFNITITSPNDTNREGLILEHIEKFDTDFNKFEIDGGGTVIFGDVSQESVEMNIKCNLGIDYSYKEGVSEDIKTRYTPVLFAFDGDDNVIFPIKWADEIKMRFTYKKLQEIKRLSVVMVYDYKGW